MKPKHLSKLTETSRNDVFANNNAISDIVKSRRYYIQKTRTAGNPGRLTQAEQTNRLIQAGQPSRLTQDISSSEDELKEEEVAALPFKRIEYFTHNFRYMIFKERRFLAHSTEGVISTTKAGGRDGWIYSQLVILLSRLA